MTNQPEILLIGAGPTGMVSALCLAKLGVSSIIVERNSGINLHPKAHELNARSIEILETLGISSGELLEEAAPFTDGARILFCKTLNEEFGRIDLYADEARRAKYEKHLKSKTPYLNLSQTALEKILLQKIQANPLITIAFQQQWQSLEQNDLNVKSEILDLQKNTTYTIESKYVLAADGAGSRCRKFLNISINGPDKIQDFVSAYFENNLRDHIQTPAKLYWVLNLEAGGTFIAHHIEKRWVYMLPIYLEYEKKEIFTKAFLENRIKKALGNEGLDIEVKSISFWRMSAQIAETFRKNRVLLVGDAAHRFPPTGGLGMNTGIGDAHNIAWKLKVVLDGLAAESLLDTYEKERKPVAEQNTEKSLFNYHKILEVIEAFNLDRDGLEKMAKFKHTAPGKWLPLSWMERIIAFASQLLSKRLDKFYTNPIIKKQVLSAIAEQVAHFDRIGLDIGYTYENGAIISDGTDLVLPEDIVTQYIPSTRPGARFPHLDFQRTEAPFSSHDLLAYDLFTLLIRKEGAVWEQGIRQLPTSIQQKIQLVDIDQLELSKTVLNQFVDLCKISNTGALLIRPDDHVAWRMEKLEGDAGMMLKGVFTRLLECSTL